jgi:hypothetical protein
MRDPVKRGELVAAAVITIGAALLHGIQAMSAGALWRDEANTVALATHGSVGDIWRNLQFDSFPILWPLLVRFYSIVFGSMNDAAFRTIGFLTGVGIIAALWLTAVVFRYRAPLISLTLFALSPSVVRWGDSLRAYGLGIGIALCVAPLVWRCIESPTRTRFVVTIVAATVSVHVLYYNTVLVLAFVAAGLAVCVRRRDMKLGFKVALTGAIPALTMLPYAVVIRAAADWNPLVQIPNYTFEWFIGKLNQTLQPAGDWALAVWVAFAVVALVMSGRYLVGRPSREFEQPGRDMVLFALVSLVVGSVGSYVFLNALSYVTQPWYYLTLLAVAAVSMDIIFGVVVVNSLPRLVKLAATIAIGVTTLFAATRSLRERLTNVDTIAYALEGRVTPRDLIVVTPWHYGVSFARYYDGDAPWITLPEMRFHEFHRYDLVKLAMEQPNQLTPIGDALERTRLTLALGGKVYVTGIPEISAHSKPARLFGKAPTPDGHWPEPDYQSQWTHAFSEYLRAHSSVRLVIHDTGRTTRYENMAVLLAEGWRP